MKKMIILVGVLLAGCTKQQAAYQPYTPIQTDSDKFVVYGTDPNLLKGFAYASCRNAKFDGYTIIESNQSYMSVKCEKNVAYADTAKDFISNTWQSLKSAVEDATKKNSN